MVDTKLLERPRQSHMNRLLAKSAKIAASILAKRAHIPPLRMWKARRREKKQYQEE